MVIYKSFFLWELAYNLPITIIEIYKEALPSFENMVDSPCLPNFEDGEWTIWIFPYFNAGAKVLPICDVPGTVLSIPGKQV